MPNQSPHEEEDSKEQMSLNVLHLPYSILLYILHFLQAPDLAPCMQVCKLLYQGCKDELLWKDKFYRNWKIDRSIPMAPGKESWYKEYKRLFYETPHVESECLERHTDQVLHVSFSHAGDMFATSSKDGFVNVWNATNPVTLRYSADMKDYNWKYTQYTQFNSSDTMLLVSGVHFGWQSTSGELAVFSLVGGFELQSRILNKPYDIFGSWYNDEYLLSGDLNRQQHLMSNSVFWLNKGYQGMELYRGAEQEAMAQKLYKFKNENASSIRTIMVADCHDTDSGAASNKTDEEPSCSRYLYHQVPESNSALSKDGSTIKYSPDYHNEQSCDYTKRHGTSEGAAAAAAAAATGGAAASAATTRVVRTLKTHSPNKHFVFNNRNNPDPEDQDDGGAGHGAQFSPELQGIVNPTHGKPSYPEKRQTLEATPVATDRRRRREKQQQQDKYLVFTMSSMTYTPHQIGIKRIHWQDTQPQNENSLGANYTPEEVRYMRNHPNWGELDDFDRELACDSVDVCIEMKGHIIGMALSPDQRYLYVNNRPWPKDAQIWNPLSPPPIAQEIDLHVIDIRTMKRVGLLHRSHIAYTSDDQCFFIFLDVSDEYVASGAEDKHGYLWDRHYGVCLTKFAHDDVVNAVAFNPCDNETLITVSDDNKIKVWRSRNRQKMLAERRAEILAFDHLRQSFNR